MQFFPSSWLHPRFFRSRALWGGGFTCLLMTACLPSARAGQYVLVSQTGGVATADGANGVWTGAYSQQDWGYGCDVYAGGPNASIVASGAIKSVFKWQRQQIPDPNNPGAKIDDPADLPPKNVFVHEFCIAERDGLFTIPSGASNDGLKGGHKLGSSFDDRYEVIPGGDMVQLTLSPSAMAQSDLINKFIHVAIGYSAFIWPLTLNFDGLTQDPATSQPPDHVLIGQGVRGHLDVGLCSSEFMPCETYPAFYDNYQWSIPGNTFASYVVTADESQGVLNPVLFTTLLTAAPHWYWAQEGAQTVTGSADVYAPVGLSSGYPPSTPGGASNASSFISMAASIGEGLFSSDTGGAPSGDFPASPLNPHPNYEKIGRMTDSRSITVERPNFDSLIASVSNAVTITLDGTVTSGEAGDKPGISVESNAGTQNMYRLGPPNSQGRWTDRTAGFIYNTQLVNSARIQRSSGNPIFATWTRSTNGEFWLDAQSHYAGTATADRNPSDSLTTDNPKTLLFTDTPATKIMDWEVNFVSVNDKFQNYLMYVPPGADVAPVPMMRFDWTWQANFISSVLNGWQSISPTYVSLGTLNPCHEHPEWSKKYISDP